MKGRWLSVDLEAVEFAKGHDGFLRGKPEPVFIIAAFAVNEGGISLLGRALKSVSVSESYPSTTKLASELDRKVFGVNVPEIYKKILILGMAVEMDGGNDVRDLYADLEKPEVLSGWAIGDLVPDPLTLLDVGLGKITTPPSASEVHLICDGLDLHERCKSDDWVGANLIVIDIDETKAASWRLHAASRDESNDWTAILRVTL